MVDLIPSSSASSAAPSPVEKPSLPDPEPVAEVFGADHDEKKSLPDASDTSADSSGYQLQSHERYPPDYGIKAWTCVFGAFCGIFASFGYIQVIGVFTEYYGQHQLQTYSSSQIAWITSVQTWLTVFCGVIVGRLYDIFGPTPLIIPGAIIMNLGIMMTSLCTEYYQFILAQGICTALGASLLFNPCVSAISTWFVKRRATASGIANAGSSLGGVIIPIIFRNVEKRAGFGWGVRAVGFLLTFFSVLCCLTVTSRLNPPGRQPIRFYQNYLKPFGIPEFGLAAGGVCLAYWGLFIPISFVPNHAVAHGFSQTLSSYLISIQNAASCFGRVVPGLLADKLGRFNMYVFGAFLCAILTSALWIPASSHVAIIMYAALYGFSSGIAFTLWQPMIADISPPQQVGARMGAVSAALSFSSLFGMPVAGAIIDANNGSYWGAAVFAACMMAAGGVVAFFSKLVLTNWNIFSLK
ncbi:major facilitator superfamily domain-containing protein [Myxozyma melibiosi]|uniref:Major facilitator superfamily domain-containing protein n=1 Tax=Myxozyma melibiosi TaxID=54550 RepID=A0ABR1EZS0_9ASCO